MHTMMKYLGMTVLAVMVAACGHNMRTEVPSVYFASGSHKIDANGQMVLDQVAADAKKRGFLNYEIYLSGYTDSAGDKKANEILAKKRVEAVLKGLLDRGIMRDRIDLRSHGERRMHVKTRDGKSEAENRRVEIRILSPMDWQ